MNSLLHRWDQWFLMHSPVPWQLRLHRYFPLALLLNAAVWALWLPWAARPARWMGSAASGAAGPWQTPEDIMLLVSHMAIWIATLGLGFLWLLRVRIHTRWREFAPAARFGVWTEYLWGCALLGLLLAPASMLDHAHAWRSQQLWQDSDLAAGLRTARQVHALESLALHSNPIFLVEWSRLAAQEARAPEAESPEAALQQLERGDATAIGAQLARYGALLRPWGYAASADPAAQAHALLAAYREALQSPLAQAWRAYPRGALSIPAPAEAREEAAIRLECEFPHRGFAASADPDALKQCFATYAQWKDGRWRQKLLAMDDAAAPAGEAGALQWRHRTHGMAVTPNVQRHLQRLVGAPPDGGLRSLGQLAATSAAAALALVIARLMSARQVALWITGLVLTIPTLLMLNMAGLDMNTALALGFAALVTTAWLRIALLQRPQAGSFLLGLATVLGVLGLAALSESLRAPLSPPPVHGLAGGDASIPGWPHFLLGAPFIALGTVLLAALLAPLWRRWRGLPQR